MEQPENHLVLAGQLHQPAHFRTTPAGIPIARFVLAHRSRRLEAGQMREVECRVSVVASGEALTAGLHRLAAGSGLRVTGFLSRAGYRAAPSQVELHALDIQPIHENG